ASSTVSTPRACAPKTTSSLTSRSRSRLASDRVSPSLVASRLAQGPDADIAERDRAVVALEQDGAGGDLLLVPGVAGRAGELQVLVDHFPIERDLDEASVGDLLALGVETGRLEDHVEGLPLARATRGVGPGRVSLIQIVVLRL